ncbi:hypothetical protein H0H93_016692 [Arthromyces matolae]|nr:hypothetical protein H0H93_016692 [Arthromyces matolae]
MASNILSSLSLFPATPEQTLESRRRSAVEWGIGRTLEEYLARDDFTDQQEVARNGKLITWVLAPRNDPTTSDFLCSCETFRREGLVSSPSNPQPKKVTCYGVASVFTPARFRGNGYAKHMMRLVHWVIADASLLPPNFPHEWGAPPPRVAHAGDGWFSTLWSDIGPDFYRQCGPTKETEGWEVRSPLSTFWNVESITSTPGTASWTLLDEFGNVKLWEDDTKNIMHTLSPVNGHKVTFAILPSCGVAAFQHWRNIDILKKSGFTLTEPLGIFGDAVTFATWTFDIMAKTLLVTRLSSPTVKFANLLTAIALIAQKHGMERIEVYNLPDTLQSEASRLNATTVERKGHLSSFKWYGEEAYDQVAWVLNESRSFTGACSTWTTMTLPPKKGQHLHYRSIWILYALIILAILFISSIFSNSRLQRNQSVLKDIPFDLKHHDDGKSYIALNISASTVAAFSLTAILPVTQNSFHTLQDVLASLLGPSQLREIILLCPQVHVSDARSAIQEILSSHPNCPDIRIQTINTGVVDPSIYQIHAAAQLSGWVLFLNEDGLCRENNRTQGILLRPPALSFPYGPVGVCFSCLNLLEPCLRRTMGYPQEAHHLLPPFVMPAALAAHFVSSPQMTDPWTKLGEHIAASRNDGIGGVVFDVETPKGSEFDIAIHEHYQGISQTLITEVVYDVVLGKPAESVSTTAWVLMVVLPTLQELLQLGPMLCTAANTSKRTLKIWIHQTTRPISDSRHYGRFEASNDCVLFYEMPDNNSGGFSAWIENFAYKIDVILSLQEDKIFTGLYTNLDNRFHFHEELVSVRLRQDDLSHTEWMSSLSLSEWKDWHKPRLDISIITNDRPHSFNRLLKSLVRARFYGDIVNLRVNVERSADAETLKIVQNIDWPHGNVFVHHRVVQGGLMAAVVESWYPQSNNTYGLLLEDDVELSPLFYAWAKMSLLRYRSLRSIFGHVIYGDGGSKSRLMFGISLYQQRNIELRPEGRRLFDARTLFNKQGILEPTTPYLSPIPCSVFKHDEAIVPNVRSNKWTKSWKKYFIELVYLRGYVMLYPNYPDFVSLSTNHLEIGSHVKILTLEKKKQFILPLMETARTSAVGLLDLPKRTLPSWDSLPVLNLTGDLTTLDMLVEAGLTRRKELTGCTYHPSLFDTQQLLCLNGTAL